MSSQACRAPAVALFAALSLCALPARGDDWLTARHDPQRTGRSEGSTRLAAPAIRWRHYLGGGVRNNQVVTADVDGDRVTDVLYISSGKLRCKHADDALVWESEPLDLQRIAGVADLDGDGRAEIIAAGSRGFVGVFEGSTGRVLWEVPPALRGVGGYARVADLDGDGLRDVYIGQCINAPISAAAFAFRGALDAPRELWRLPPGAENACGTESDVIGDVDGDGANDVVLTLGFSRMYVYDGATGALRYEVPAPASSPFGSFTWTLLRQLDADPALELVAITNGYANIASPYGARRIVVYDQGADRRSARVLWEAALSAPDRSELRFDLTSVQDLDGDGAPEVVVSELDPTTRTWSMVVRDARDGRALARQPGADFTTVEDINGDGRPVVLSIDDDRALVARRYAAGGFTTVWTIPQVRPMRTLDVSRPPLERPLARVLFMQLDDDRALELVVAPFDPEVPPERRVVTEVKAYDVETGAPRALGTWRAPLGATVSLATSGARLSRPYDQPILVTSDGYLLALDRAMEATNRVVGAEFTVPGMRVGGFYAGTNAGPAPIAGALSRDGSERAVFIRDSRPVLLRLDVGRASLAAPPRVRWELPGFGPACIADLDGDGAREVVAMHGRDVVAVDPGDGARERWRSRDAAGPVGSVPLWDILPLRRSDGAVDVFFGRVDPGNLYRPTALRGTDGSVRWNTFASAPSSGFGHFALGDLTGDGTDDAFTGINVMVLVDGATGALAREGAWAPYALPIIAPFSGSEAEVFVGGSFLPDRLVSRELTVRGALEGPAASSPFGALLRCGSSPAVAVTPANSSQVIALRPQALPAMGPPGDAVLARATLVGGRRYASDSEVPADARRGTLSSLTAVRDLDGRGTQGILVGSTDGWLYALDACALTLLWSMDFHEPVGEAVVADTDGDGTHDVMITVGDGYLYGLGPRTLGASAAVRDLAPPGADDVDEVETFDTLSASWDAVSGARSYLVRALSFGGTALRFPESVEVTATSVTLRELPLLLGGRYRVGVTAIAADGSGVEVLSDGVTVVDRTRPTVAINLSRESFAPRALETVDIRIEAADRTGLTRAHAEIRDAQGAVVRVLDDYESRSRDASRSARVTWGGTDGRGVVAPEATYTVVATATDVGGMSTTETATVRVVAPPANAPRPFAPPRDEGCGCGAVGRPRAGSIVALAAVGLLARRRRRR